MSIVNADFVPSTTISSSEMDANFDDIADEITNSVAVDGQSSMSAQLKLSDGTVGTPALGFSLDSNTGLYRIGTDNIGVGVAGAKVLDIDSTGLAVTGDISGTAGLSIAQDVAFTGDITPAQITANTDDYAPTGHATAYVFRLSTDASRDLTGLDGGADGRKVLILNVGSFNIVLKDESTDSTAANRFQLFGDLTLSANTGVELIYDDTADRWRPTSPQINATTVGAGKQSIWIPAGAMTPNATNGPTFVLTETSTNAVMLHGLAFDPTTVESAQFSIAAPKSWNESTVTFKAFWRHGSTTTNFGATWSLKGVAVSNDDALDAAFGTLQSVDDTGGTTDDLYVTAESSALTISGTPAEGDLLFFKVSRETGDSGDTMAIDAILQGVMLFYTTDVNTDD